MTTKESSSATSTASSSGKQSADLLPKSGLVSKAVASLEANSGSGILGTNGVNRRQSFVSRKLSDGGSGAERSSDRFASRARFSRANNEPSYVSDYEAGHISVLQTSHHTTRNLIDNQFVDLGAKSEEQSLEAEFHNIGARKKSVENEDSYSALVTPFVVERPPSALSNYADIELQREEPRKPNVDCPRYTYVFDKEFHVVTDLWMEQNLPAIYVDESVASEANLEVQICWTDFLGHAIAHVCKLEFGTRGGFFLDEDFMTANMAQFTRLGEQTHALAGVGHVPALTEWSHRLPKYKLSVMLPFFFSRRNGDALPLDKCELSTPSVELSPRERFRDLLQMRERPRGSTSEADWRRVTPSLRFLRYVDDTDSSLPLASLNPVGAQASDTARLPPPVLRARHHKLHDHDQLAAREVFSQDLHAYDIIPRRTFRVAQTGDKQTSRDVVLAGNGEQQRVWQSSEQDGTAGADRFYFLGDTVVARLYDVDEDFDPECEVARDLLGVVWMAKNLDASNFNDHSNYTTNSISSQLGWNPCASASVQHGIVGKYERVEHSEFELTQPWLAGRFSPFLDLSSEVVGINSVWFNRKDDDCDATRLALDARALKTRLTVQLGDTNPYAAVDACILRESGISSSGGGGGNRPCRFDLKVYSVVEKTVRFAYNRPVTFLSVDRASDAQ